MSATLAPDVVLYQSPDLRFGGEYVGNKRYQVWADAMSAIFDRVDAQDPEFFEKGDTVVIVCTLVTRIRTTAASGAEGSLDAELAETILA